MKPYRWLVAFIAGAFVLAACAELQAAVPEVEAFDVVVASALEATEVPLLAGQGMEVGIVTVTNDLDEVCVTYALDEDALEEGWGIHETHLFIGTSADDIPTNRAGNPVPGRFPYGEFGLLGVETWEHCIPLGNLSGTLVVAAHAVIKRHEEIVPTLAWSRSSEASVKSFEGYGAQWDPDADGFSIALDASQQPVWDRGAIDSRAGSFPTLSYASWRHQSAAGHVDLRRFQATFELPTGFEVLGAKIASVHYEDRIPINDNIYVFLNRSLQFWGGTIMGEPLATYDKVFLGMPGVGVLGHGTDGMGTGGWYIPRGNLPPVSPSAFETGPNVLDVFAEEFRQWGGMNELALTLKVLDATSVGESAWGDGERITAQGNWGTYFTHVLTCASERDDRVLVEPFGTAAYTPIPTFSNIDLLAGKNYKLVASGTYRFANWGEYGIADAAWNARSAAYAPGGVAGWYQQASKRLQVWINGGPVAWQPATFNPLHVYSLMVQGDDDRLEFTISDDQYSDNTGFITVDIFRCP
jgi:hypothetical protein